MAQSPGRFFRGAGQLHQLVDDVAQTGLWKTIDNAIAQTFHGFLDFLCIQISIHDRY